MKESMNKQKHLAQWRKGAELEKKIKQLFMANHWAAASLREFGHSFTPSQRSHIANNAAAGCSSVTGS